jgi:hypothetical protein
MPAAMQEIFLYRPRRKDSMEPDTLQHAMILIRTLVEIHGDYDDLDAWKKIENVLDELKG